MKGGAEEIFILLVGGTVSIFIYYCQTRKGRNQAIFIWW